MTFFWYNGSNSFPVLHNRMLPYTPDADTSIGVSSDLTLSKQTVTVLGHGFSFQS
jgi:hypothetical protein